jgi:hypothetical protein
MVRDLRLLRHCISWCNVSSPSCYLSVFQEKGFSLEMNHLDLGFGGDRFDVFSGRWL